MLVRHPNVFSRHLDDVEALAEVVRTADEVVRGTGEHVQGLAEVVQMPAEVVEMAVKHVGMTDEPVEVSAEHVRVLAKVVQVLAEHVGTGNEHIYAHAEVVRADPKVMKTKAPLCRILKRASRSLLVMKRLAEGDEPWQAEGVVSPEEFEALLKALVAQEKMLLQRESALAVCAREWDGILRQWHAESVSVVKIGRACFRRTVKAAAWRGLKARGGGRARTAKEGAAIEAAWESSGRLWEPKPGLNFAGFQKRRTDAEAAAKAHALTANAAAIERGMLLKQADALYDWCVKWYVVATACFKAETAQGKLIRTVPTNYDLKLDVQPPKGPAASGAVVALSIGEAMAA